MLYLHGKLELIAQTAPKAAANLNLYAAPKPARDGIAIVGSRNATPQGLANAHAFAKAFSEAGLVVVSGLVVLMGPHFWSKWVNW